MLGRLDVRVLAQRLPRRTLRLRLTLVYGALFLVSGAVLLAITYALVAHQYTGKFFATTVSVKGGTVTAVKVGAAAPDPTLPGNIAKTQLLAAGKQHSTAALRQLLLQSGIALGIMALVSIWLGWVVAGRALRPLRTITNAAREISASSLHRRLSLAGPDDELKQLAHTFDDLLGRLEAAFEAQRRFVANASHELRTPLTLERALVEVALADPDATVESLRATCERVLAAGEQQERLIEALLTLSRSQRGLDRREPFDLAAVAEDVLASRRGEVDRLGLRVDTSLGAAPTEGDPRLGERLVANLVDNAVRHNLERGGWLEVTTRTRAGKALLTVTNSGEPVGAADVERILEPFQRLDGERHGHEDGLGLGLSIVQAIAVAHGAQLELRPQRRGGLGVEVGFPAVTR